MYTDGMSKNKKVLIVALCILLGMGIWIVKARNNLTHVEGYRETSSNGGACLAVSPECGVCYDCSSHGQTIGHFDASF
jgi:hypothetical protein